MDPIRLIPVRRSPSASTMLLLGDLGNQRVDARLLQAIIAA